MRLGLLGGSWRWAGLWAGAVQGCLRGLSAAIGLVRAGLASFRVGHGDVPPNEVFSGVQLWDELFWRAVVEARLQCGG